MFLADNLWSQYLGLGEVMPGVKGNENGDYHEVTSDVSTSFVLLCAIYFPSVTGPVVSTLCLPLPENSRWSEANILWL